MPPERLPPGTAVPLALFLLAIPLEPSKEISWEGGERSQASASFDYRSFDSDWKREYFSFPIYLQCFNVLKHTNTM